LNESNQPDEIFKFVRSDYRVIVRENPSGVRGEGVEIWCGNDLVSSIFRNDTHRKREIKVFSLLLLVEQMEGFIEIFKELIQWDFRDLPLSDASELLA
jgi:hypothetical protein